MSANLKRVSVLLFILALVAMECRVANELQALKSKAAHGDTQAQVELGGRYLGGKDVPQDYAEAAKWYRKAADQGHAGAQIKLGSLYETGHGVPRDLGEAQRWYERAATTSPPGTDREKARQASQRVTQPLAPASPPP